MFGGVPQPQISRNGPKRPETAGKCFWCRRAAGPQAGGEKIYYVLLLVTINFLFPGATAPKQGRGTPTSRFRPLNLRVSARAITSTSQRRFGHPIRPMPAKLGKIGGRKSKIREEPICCHVCLTFSFSNTFPH